MHFDVALFYYVAIDPVYDSNENKKRGHQKERPEILRNNKTEK